jgi:hypothetical protein
MFPYFIFLLRFIHSHDVLSYAYIYWSQFHMSVIVFSIYGSDWSWSSTCSFSSLKNAQNRCCPISEFNKASYYIVMCYSDSLFIVSHYFLAKINLASNLLRYVLGISFALSDRDRLCYSFCVYSGNFGNIDSWICYEKVLFDSIRRFWSGTKTDNLKVINSKAHGIDRTLL